MRLLDSLLLASVLIMAAGCSAQLSAAPIASSPQATVAEYRAASPGTGLDPVVVGKQLLESGGDLRWLEAPTPVFVQQMTYAEAHKWIPMLSEEGDRVWGSQTSVWLVVFKGRWQWLPYGQTEGTPQPTIYDGCLLVLFRAADGSMIATGDSLCPGQN